jgi:hypothetical protein
MDAVEVGGQRIAYTRAGHGPSLLLLQGFVGDGQLQQNPTSDGVGWPPASGWEQRFG